MKQVALSYWQFDDVEMSILDEILIEISGQEIIKKAIMAEPKLKSSAIQSVIKGKLEEGFIEKVSGNLEEYFNVFNQLGNHFLEKHAKKYEPVSKKFVSLKIEQYEQFLTEQLKAEGEILYLLTMVRFLKQNGSYTEQIKYLLQSDMLKKTKHKKTVRVQNGVNMVDSQNIQKRMHEMLDDIFKVFGDPEQIAALKEEHAANIKKIKSLEKNISGIAKEIESSKQTLAQEITAHKQTKILMSEQKQLLDERQEEITQLQDVNSRLQKELKVSRNTIDHQAVNHKKALETLEERLRKENQIEIMKIEEEKNELEESIQTFIAVSSELRNANTKLREEAMQSTEIIKSLQVKLATLNEELNNTKSIVNTNSEVNVMPITSVAATKNHTIQRADSHLLKTVGFGYDETCADLDEDDSDLFDLDENVPSFD